MLQELLVDPVVSRAKFDREVGLFRALEREHRRRGWFMLKAEFPNIDVLFAAAKVKPAAPLVFGVALDFSNYDLWAPSVRIVDPLSWEPLTYAEVHQRFIIAQVRTVSTPTPFGVQQMPQQQDLMQAYTPEEIPFLCLPGVREYHSAPAHTGDSWLLHRGRGEGSLNFILEQLYQFGVARVVGWNVHLLPQIIGFGYSTEQSDDRLLRG